MAYFAERADSYAFYTTDVWLKNLPTFLIALTTFVVIAVLAWRNGRTYCNTICPVGTILGLLSRYAWLRPHIDTSKCNSCGLCARNCKASCIDPKEHRIDYSRCVTCMDCLETCHKGAITYTHPRKITGNSSENHVNVPTSRRQFLVTAGVLVAGAIEAQEKKVDGGLAPILDKEIPQRSTPIAPPGALSLRNIAQHCTACQLCVSVCPNQVLRPSSKFLTFMQPEMSYERGYFMETYNQNDFKEANVPSYVLPEPYTRLPEQTNRRHKSVMPYGYGKTAYLLPMESNAGIAPATVPQVPYRWSLPTRRTEIL